MLAFTQLLQYRASLTSLNAVEKLLQIDQISMRKARFNHLRLRRTPVGASKSGDAATAADNTKKMPLLCRGVKDW